jgi:hypothetical protein
MNKRVFIGVSCIVVAAVVLACIFLLRGGEDDHSERATRVESQASPAPIPVETKPPVPVAIRPKKMDEAAKKARAETLAAILAAITRLSGDKEEPRELSMDPGQASKSEQELLQYVREPLREIRPLLRGCYQRALREDQTLSGVVRVKFSIVADEDHGGLIESSEILESGTSEAIQAMGECLRETMYALRFEKPTGAGRITVVYPMVFSTGENTPEVPREQLRPKFEVEGFNPR